MLEMTETANILHNATDRSLVLMDEVGRGTSTFDGLSLAWACAAFIATKIRAFTLFATHYFELTSLAGEAPGVVNVHVEAVEHGDALVFLHSVKEGPANQSYGLQVAALAGIPKSVTAAARRYLTELERERDALRNSVSPQTELPLVVAPPGAAGGPSRSAVLDALRAIDPNTLSPREALDLLFRLQQLDSEERDWKKASDIHGANRPSRRKAAVCRATARGKHHAAVVTGNVNCALAPQRRVSSTSTVPSLGAFERPEQPAEAERQIPRDDAQLARTVPTALARRRAAPHGPCSPMMRLPNGSRARRCAARLPRTGEPSSTMRPGGNGLRSLCMPSADNCVREEFQDHRTAHAMADQVQRIRSAIRPRTRARARALAARSAVTEG